MLLSLILTQHEHAKNVNKQFDSQQGEEYYLHLNNLSVMYSTGQNKLINGLKAKIEGFALRTPKGLEMPEYL